MISGRAIFAIALLHTAGCAEAPGQAGYPQAPVRPHAFQQFCEQATSVPHASALAIARGAEGFELVAMYNGVLCYKRPVAEVAPARATTPPPAAPAPAGTMVPILRDPGF